jgi:Skp family chaperone for outer membrane proteins
MKTITTLAAAVLAATTLGSPASAQSAAVADLQGAIAQSAAFNTARTQVQSTYKTQIDAAQARATALQTQLQPLATELQTLQANPATPPATLQQKAQAFQQRRDAAAREVQTLSTSFERPLAYAQEQIADKLDAAVKAAMQAKNVSVLINPQAVVTIQPQADITADIVAQLNNQVKTVSITPPAGWQPGQQRTAAATPAPTGPAPARPAAPQGR